LIRALPLRESVHCICRCNHSFAYVFLIELHHRRYVIRRLHHPVRIRMM
jgi:hypothetical protein